MFKQKRVNEEVDGLEGQCGSDDRQRHFSDCVWGSGLFDALKQHQSGVGTEQRSHDGPSLVLRGGPALDIHRAFAHEQASRELGFDVCHRCGEKNGEFTQGC